MNSPSHATGEAGRSDVLTHNSRLIKQRRLVFLGFNLVLFGLALIPMISLLARQGWDPLRLLLWLIFIPLIAQVVFGFTLAATGFVLLRRGGDPIRINRLTPAGAPSELAATAIVMPIFNEDVERVFQGLRTIYESVEKTGRGQAFDFFILSDSNDPNHWIAEEMAWLNLCKQVGGFGRVFYRKRRVSLHHKSGNIADFCRRWGDSYRYMIVLDADSVMSGPTCVRLAELMEANPRTGIIQTNPRLALGQTLLQRIMQFGAQLCTPLYAAGMNFWQFDSGNYWGHNAIVRLKPFMKYCAIPELPESGPFGRRVFSHDTIEAALMRRAGYAVWFAYDLAGSYEESPPHLLASLQRDRRWCFGNLQHLWFLFGRGLRPASRLHLLNGIMAYLSSPLWLLFLALSTLLAILEPGFADSKSSFQAVHGRLLFAGIMFLLLTPKALGVLLLWRSPRLAALGGRGRILLSALGEAAFSIIIAPILMLFYTRFVCAALLGSQATWKPQARGGDELGFGPVWSLHLGHTLLALGWLGVLAWLKPVFLPWMIPVFFGLFVAVPLTRLTASLAAGRWARIRKLFLTFEEAEPPPELQAVAELPANPEPAFFQSADYAPNYGLLQAVLDPYVNSVHVSMLRQRTQATPETRELLNALMERLLLEGPADLAPREKSILLWDADSMLSAHRKLWSSPASHLHDWWQAAFRHYNETNALALRRSLSGF
jgi:membrane glycosyltransferase